jgi:hypothetical protein
VLDDIAGIAPSLREADAWQPLLRRRRCSAPRSAIPMIEVNPTCQKRATTAADLLTNFWPTGSWKILILAVLSGSGDLPVMADSVAKVG